jgi:hypothetical protein
MDLYTTVCIKNCCLHLCFSKEELYEIADVPDPESLTLGERRLARLTAEDLQFDAEHYL